MPLTEHPDVAALAALADSLGPEGDAIETGIDLLTAACGVGDHEHRWLGDQQISACGGDVTGQGNV
ncbi:hypothetical protein [Streptomyces sp. NPDC058674]|uniref:hypothetical protein n=1 Tax=Streptomyces sp. NPDC058674 TaxID=3346592 RepID=UPI00365C3CE4